MDIINITMCKEEKEHSVKKGEFLKQENGSNYKDANSIKIIQSNKFKNHMIAHEGDFIIPWQSVLKEAERRGAFNELHLSFDNITVTFEQKVGNCVLVEANEEKDVLYAKRVGRDIYSRFIKNRAPCETNKCTFFLKKSNERDFEYYLVTMFCGMPTYKEPQDKNISSLPELKESLKFWSTHALIYDESIIDINSITKICPYSEPILEKRILCV